MSKLIKPVFYEDIDELIGGLLLKKKKKKKKITYAPSKYSKLGKIEPLPIIRRAVPVIPLVVPPLLPPPPRGLVEYFTGLVPGSRKPAKKAPRKRRTKAEMFIERAREAEIPRRRTHAEQLADLGRDVDKKTLSTLTKYQRKIRKRLEEIKNDEERRLFIEEETRRLKESPATSKLSGVLSKTRQEQIARARKEGKLKPIPPLLPRPPAEEKDELYYDPALLAAPADLFPRVPPKLPGELALLAAVKRPVGRPPKLPAEKAAVKVSPKAGIPVVGFENVGKKLPPEPSKKSAPIETFFTPKGKGKFKNQQRKKRSK
jgi:hypothetical protein